PRRGVRGEVTRERRLGVDAALLALADVHEERRPAHARVVERAERVPESRPGMDLDDAHAARRARVAVGGRERDALVILDLVDDRLLGRAGVAEDPADAGRAELIEERVGAAPRVAHQLTCSWPSGSIAAVTSLTDSSDHSVFRTARHASASWGPRVSTSASNFMSISASLIGFRACPFGYAISSVTFAPLVEVMVMR